MHIQDRARLDSVSQFQLNSRIDTRKHFNSTFAGHNWIERALEKGIEMRTAGSVSTVAGLVVSPLYVFVAGAIDTILHAANAIDNTILLLKKSFYWIFAKTLPRTVELNGNIFEEAYLCLTTLIATIPTAALSIFSPSTALAITIRVGLIRDKPVTYQITENIVEYVADTDSNMSTQEEKVQGIFSKIWSATTKRVYAHTHIALTVALAAGLAVTAGIIHLATPYVYDKSVFVSGYSYLTARSTPTSSPTHTNTPPISKGRQNCPTPTPTPTHSNTPDRLNYNYFNQETTGTENGTSYFRENQSLQLPQTGNERFENNFIEPVIASG